MTTAAPAARRAVTAAPTAAAWWRAEALRWGYAVLLLLPLLLTYAVHLTPAPATAEPWEPVVPTGFLHIDMPAYMANAREHFDQGFRLTYANPANPTYEGAPIYFQPHIFLLGVMTGPAGMDPGWALIAFGVVVGLLMIRLMIALVEEVAGLATFGGWLVAGLFVWGGGVLALAGIAQALVRGVDPFPDAAFALDPENGWWFLNVGRNLVFPTETWYHVAFFACALALMRQRWVLAVIAAFLLGISQPFTGVQLLILLPAWAALERWWLGNRAVPAWLPLAGAGLFVLHVGYYLVFLPLFPEHASLTENWMVPWLYQADAFVPALALVALPVLWRFRTASRAGVVLEDPRNRLLLVWFLVIFVTANHGFAIDPIVELHFVRGYDWAALFLLGAPVLVLLVNRLVVPDRGRLLQVAGIAAVAVGSLVFVSDNLAWFTQRPVMESVRLLPAQVELYEFLDRPENARHVLVSQDLGTGFLATVYTPLHTWAGQRFNTPGFPDRLAQVERFFETGEVPLAWERLPILVVKFAGEPLPPGEFMERGRLVYENPVFQVFRVEPEVLLQAPRGPALPRNPLRDCRGMNALRNPLCQPVRPPGTAPGNGAAP